MVSETAVFSSQCRGVPASGLHGQVPDHQFALQLASFQPYTIVQCRTALHFVCATPAVFDATGVPVRLVKAVALAESAGTSVVSETTGQSGWGCDSICPTWAGGVAASCLHGVCYRQLSGHSLR